MEGSILRKCHVAVTKITRSYLDIWLKTFISHTLVVPSGASGHLEDYFYGNTLEKVENFFLLKTKRQQKL